MVNQLDVSPIYAVDIINGDETSGKTPETVRKKIPL